MQKAINIENSSNNVVRVHSIMNAKDINFNPTGLEYILIEDFIEPPELPNPLAKNYAVYDKPNKAFKWVQVQYENTATEEIFQIENLKSKNSALEVELQTANENINMLIELQADIIGGAI